MSGPFRPVALADLVGVRVAVYRNLHQSRPGMPVWSVAVPSTTGGSLREVIGHLPHTVPFDLVDVTCHETALAGRLREERAAGGRPARQVVAWLIGTVAVPSSSPADMVALTWDRDRGWTRPGPFRRARVNDAVHVLCSR